MDSKNPCPFCTLNPARVRHENETFVVIRDGFPISPGHTLIIPKQHLASLFVLEAEQFLHLHAALHWAKSDLECEFSPDSFNVGINDGAAAGQTVPHLHIHLIPRYQGDQLDPRGGVRWIMPAKAKYW